MNFTFKMVIWGRPDFLWILMEQGLPSATTTYLINGDVADRGDNAVEIFLLIFALKLIHPASIFFNRGNHEMEEMNSRDGGFMHEVTISIQNDGFCINNDGFCAGVIQGALGDCWFLGAINVKNDFVLKC